MTTAEGHTLTVSGDRDREGRKGVYYDVLVFPMMEPGDHVRCPEKQQLQKMWLGAGSCEAVNLIGISAQGLLEEAANGKKMPSICRLPRRPNQSRRAGGDRQNARLQ
jgi:hypothetical protein